MTATLWASAHVGLRYRERLVLPLDVPAWLPSTAWRSAAVAAVVVLAVWLNVKLLGAVWLLWVRAEQHAVLAHNPPHDAAMAPLTALGTVVWLVLLGSFIVIRGDVAAMQIRDLDDLVVLPMLPIGLALLSTSVLLLLKRPPGREESSQARAEARQSAVHT